MKYYLKPAAASLLLLCSTASADWRFEESKDQMTGFDTSIAYVNKANCDYRCPFIAVLIDGTIYFDLKEYIGGETALAMVDFDNAGVGMPMLVDVDKNGKTARLKKKTDLNNYGYVLDGLKSKTKVTVRIYDFQNVPTTLSFSLKGSASAIQKVISRLN